MLFRVELRDLVGEGHPMVRLTNEVDWDHFEEVFGSPTSMVLVGPESPLC
jgi:hypothetical protein